jgi:hypothetical protein
LWNTDATVHGYKRMVEGQANDLYPFDMDTWSTTDEDMPFVDTTTSSLNDTKTFFKYGKLILLFFH